MKKSVTLIAALALAGAVALTATGCGSSATSFTSLASNWFYDAEFGGIQPTFCGEENAEEMSYKVTFHPSGSANYSVDYPEEGVYTTKFYAKKVTAAELATIVDPENEGWQRDYLNSLGGEGFAYMYYYQTALDVPKAVYSYQGNEKVFDEGLHVSAESYFLSVKDFLSPVYTRREVKSYEPKEYAPKSLDDCYTLVDRVYTSYYSISGWDVRTVTENRAAGTTETFSQGSLKDHNSVFDRSYLDIAVRAMKNLYGSQTVNIYTPSIPVRSYTIAGGSRALSDNGDKNAELQASIQELLENNGLHTRTYEEAENGQGPLKNLETVAVSVHYNGGDFAGIAQTYWFAGRVDGKNNARTVLLKYEEPLSFGLGSFEYVLNTVNVHI